MASNTTLKTYAHGNYCCVVGCHNRKGKDLVHFFSFPAPSRNLEQRELWIKAVKRIEPDGSQWIPSKRSIVCADHFVKKKPSPTRTDPDYAPSIFPTKHGKAATLSDVQREKRRKDRRSKTTVDKINMSKEDPENDEQVGHPYHRISAFLFQS